jgi:hypothetical protein
LNTNALVWGEFSVAVLLAEDSFKTQAIGGVGGKEEFD